VLTVIVLVILASDDMGAVLWRSGGLLARGY
jgi:hypothetical protein